MTMTNKQAYDSVVSLTQELAKTEFPKRLFEYVEQGDIETVESLVSCFPIFYPELYQQIADFGKAYNEFIGESPADDARRNNILKKGGYLLYSLAFGNILSEISSAIDSGEAEKIKEIFDKLKEQHSGIVEEFATYQNEFSEYKDVIIATSNNGKIFGVVANEEKGVYVFDPNVIDVLSFYVLNIYANIADIDFFEDNDGELTAAAPFFEAIEEATNNNFCNFVRGCNFVDCIESAVDNFTIAELLVYAYEDDF